MQLVEKQNGVFSFRQLWEKLNLGIQAYSGVFLMPGENVPVAPLTLVECQACGLVQLDRLFDASVMYGPTYGYRSGLNASMERHLQQRAVALIERLDTNKDITFLDIGSSDGTLLNEVVSGDVACIGCDPQAERFKEHYDRRVTWVSTFFSSGGFFEALRGRHKADIITTIAMFYDLDDTVDFSQ